MGTRKSWELNSMYSCTVVFPIGSRIIPGALGFGRHLSPAASNHTRPETEPGRLPSSSGGASDVISTWLAFTAT